MAIVTNKRKVMSVEVKSKVMPEIENGNKRSDVFGGILSPKFYDTY